MTHQEIIEMARAAGMRANEGHTDKDGKHHPAINALSSSVPIQWLERFAALVAAKAAANERARLFGADRQLDGEMRLQLTRWESGECFAAAMHFTAEQTHCGPDSLLQLAVDELDKQIDAGIEAAICARGNT